MGLMRMKEASEYSGLHPNTLRKYIDRGIIRGIRIGTHRFVDKTEIDRFTGKSRGIRDDTAIIYARVSTKKQAENLVRQKERLMRYCERNGLKIVDIIDDVASGINEKRRGLRKLFKRVRKRETRNVVVEYDDRLARFGLNYIKEVFDNNGVKLIVANQENLPPEGDLVKDLIAIVTSFSARIYGKSGAKKIIRTIKEECEHA